MQMLVEPITIWLMTQYAWQEVRCYHTVKIWGTLGSALLIPCQYLQSVLSILWYVGECWTHCAEAAEAEGAAHDCARPKATRATVSQRKGLSTRRTRGVKPLTTDQMARPISMTGAPPYLSAMMPKGNCPTTASRSLGAGSEMLNKFAGHCRSECRVKPESKKSEKAWGIAWHLHAQGSDTA